MLLTALALSGAVAPARAAQTDWQILELGNPVPGAPAGVAVGAVAVQTDQADTRVPYLFSILAGEIFMTYRYDGRWQWAKTGPPSGRVAAELPIGVVVGQPLNGQAERPYVFVRGTDGHLWVCSLVGVDWVWTDLGTPPGGDIVAAVGAVAVHDGQGLAGRPYVFVTGADGKLWLTWWTGRDWHWDDRGTPPGAVVNPYYARVGVTVRQPSPGGPEHPQAFLLDVRGDLWRHGWDGSAWRWTNHGRPVPTVAWPHGLGVVDLPDPRTRTSHVAAYTAYGAQVFAFDLYGDTGGWTPQGVVTGTQWVDPVGVVAVRENRVGPAVPRVHVAQLDAVGPIWQGGTGQTWTPIRGTSVQSAGGRDTGDSVVIDSPSTADQTTYVFFWAGKRNNLTVAWSTG
ncbi:hypothetical protein [Verrucosispora sioxanthis]|uniref:Exo-alpha-sialidase n=1 Tax=Verrucosispora sioxanthis TaxID=2499994 RepID=A0A6M1KYQ4_9ACTN|nr:hypothetical protein [Verrucosispora sioxanthis]NEE64956.1 hypothetical protein [Verrucosispora sioxanthis]NGM14066.1 hypothetical protein [Verrucosispora sioxanthis]